jgi:hypothetical protein
MDNTAKQNASQPNANFPVGAELSRRNQFSQREVGLNHPDTNSFLRLNDEGDVEIFAAPGVGIVISASSRTISFFAEKVRFFCAEDGLRWNEFNFNYSASDYSQPTLVKVDPKSIHMAQNSAYHYLAKLNEEYGFSQQQPETGQKYTSAFSMEGLNPDQIVFLDNILKDHSTEYVEYVVELMKNGYSNQQAKEKADKDKNV